MGNHVKMFSPHRLEGRLSSLQAVIKKLGYSLDSEHTEKALYDENTIHTTQKWINNGQIAEIFMVDSPKGGRKCSLTWVD